MMTASQRLLKMSDMLRCNHIKACVDMFENVTDNDKFYTLDESRAIMGYCIELVKQASDGFER